MQQNELIKHIAVAGELFAVSYYNRVDFYQYRDGTLTLTNSMPGYSNAFIANDAATVLLATVAGSKTTGKVSEVRLDDMQPTGLVIKNTILAMYHQGAVIYVTDNHQLKRLINNNHEVIADNIPIRSFEQSTIKDNKLYYLSTKAAEKTVAVYDFDNGMQQAIELDGVEPTRIVMVNDVLYIRTQQVLRPKLMVGTIVEN
jgi:hypothetical protein